MKERAVFIASIFAIGFSILLGHNTKACNQTGQRPQTTSQFCFRKYCPKCFIIPPLLVFVITERLRAAWNSFIRSHNLLDKSLCKRPGISLLESAINRSEWICNFCTMLPPHAAHRVLCLGEIYIFAKRNWKRGSGKANIFSQENAVIYVSALDQHSCAEFDEHQRL